MMYRVVHEKGKKDIAVVSVRPDALELKDVLITDGNAANNPTNFYDANQGLAHIRDQWSIIQSEFWRPDDGSKRKIMSECLVPHRVPPELIDTIYVASQEGVDRVRRGLPQAHVSAEPYISFQPRRSFRIGDKISLVDGDMFFSDMQTLTVSVNLQGIMGKGLASRAKYQFPDVYVFYQDACRSRKLTATKPCLYKREASLDEELADLEGSSGAANAVKWFLLFATKRKWRDDSRLDDIEAGLAWLEQNYKGEGILSLALPALGCGLGGLEWREVGPLMCRTLSRLSIPSAIYLPRERGIEDQYLREDFLLHGRA